MATPLPSKKKTAPPQRGFIAEWTVVLLQYLFLTTSVAQAFIVPTGSMTSTLMVGDHLVVDKLTYGPSGDLASKLLPFSEPKRGDIICFRYPLDIRETYVKRVVGVPGDRIRFEDKQLILNGRRVHEPYLRLMPERQSDYLNNFPRLQPDIMIYPRGLEMLRDHVVDGELVVPPGHYFAIGDNRDDSADSRFWGLVPRENINGKPLIVWWSYDTSTERLADRNIISPGHIADLAMNFFSKTRWERTFRLVRGYDLE